MTSVYVQNEGKGQVTIYTDMYTYASVSKLIIKKIHATLWLKYC